LPEVCFQVPTCANEAVPAYGLGCCSALEKEREF
jgi:hypothetical protein